MIHRVGLLDVCAYRLQFLNATLSHEHLSFTNLSTTNIFWRQVNSLWSVSFALALGS